MAKKAKGNPVEINGENFKIFAVTSGIAEVIVYAIPADVYDHYELWKYNQEEIEALPEEFDERLENGEFLDLDVPYVMSV